MRRRNLRTASEKGASLVEYALLLALIAIVCIGAVTALGNEADDPFIDARDGLTGP